MPAPGDTAPARIEKLHPRPGLGSVLLPVAARCHGRAELNQLQFLTIRRYLGFVFLALVLLLLALALWQ